MSGLNDSVLRNNPVWGSDTTVAVGTIPAAVHPANLVTIPLSGTYFILSNNGAANFYVTPDPTFIGILVAPGESFEFACKAGTSVSLIGSAAGQDFTLTQFS